MCIYIYRYIYIYIDIYIYTISFYLIKSSYTEGKQVSWFLIFFEMSSDSFVIKYKVKFCDCYAFVCLKYKDKFCDTYAAEMWLLHQRFICLNVWKLYSAIFDYKIKFLNKKLCSLNCGWLKETFWQYVTIDGLDKYNVSKCGESLSSE